MTNTEILTKAMQKAIKNGWDDHTPYSFSLISEGLHKAVLEMELDNAEFSVIFDHRFAKALWGDANTLNLHESKELGYVGGLGAGVRTVGWRDHLQQMVVAADPIKYLGENI